MFSAMGCCKTWTLDSGLDWTGLDRKFDDHFLQFLMCTCNAQVHGLSTIIYFVWSHRPEVFPYPDLESWFPGSHQADGNHDSI